ASASQIVSKPPSSIARACSRISSSGSMVSCMTPMRSGGMPRFNQAGSAVSGAKELHELEIGVDANSGRKLVALEPAPRRIVLPVLVGRAEDVAACALDLGAFPACEHEREPDLPDRLTAGKPGIAGRQIRALEPRATALVVVCVESVDLSGALLGDDSVLDVAHDRLRL